tara:strand:- start:1700 stop:1873 length:174 start_codon:yes stop_codon:yes gene_type:complete
MNKSIDIIIIQSLLLLFGAAFLFTSFMLGIQLFWVDALYAGSAGLFSLALVYLSNRF